MHFVPQDITNEEGSYHKTNQQDQYVDFNLSELNEETGPDQLNCNRRVRNFIEVLNLLDQSLPRTSKQKVKKIIQLEGSEEFLSNYEMPVQATKGKTITLFITKDVIRNNLDQADKKSTIEQGRTIEEGRGYSPLTKIQGGRGHSPIQKGKKGEEIVP